MRKYFKKLFSASEIKPLSIKEIPKTDSLLKWILFFIWPYKNPLSIFMGYRLFRYTYFALLPVAVGFAIDKLQDNMSSADFNWHVSWGLAYLLGYAFMLSNAWVFRTELVLTEMTTRSLALLGISILNRLPMDWHNSRPSGLKQELVMDARRGLFELLRSIRWVMMPVVGSLVGLSISLYIFDGPFYFYPVFLLFFAIYLFCSWYFNRPIRAQYGVYKDSHARLVSKLYEFSSSIITVKSGGLESFIEKKAWTLEHDAQSARNIIYSTVFKRWFIVNTAAAVFLILVCVLAVYANTKGQLSSGSTAGIIMLFYSFWVTLEAISVSQDQINEYVSAIRRFISLCRDAEMSPEDGVGGLNIPEWSNLQFHNVSYSYASQDSVALKGISCCFKRGEINALVGPSGAGKSTLIKLILGLYVPTEGDVLLDEIPLAQTNLSAWLRKLAYVPQDIELFDGTIRENIIMDRVEVSAAEYQKILEQACLFEFINTLPDASNTKIGERGLRLSGGQKQRIGVARALLRDADLILLDEATSALDSITENQIQDTLFKNLKDKTLIVIAHRLSTIRSAHHIVVLNNGEVSDAGCFDELLLRNGLFAEMWGIQGLAKQ